MYWITNHCVFSVSEASEKKTVCLELENKNIFEKLMDLEMRMKQMSNMQHPALIAKPSEVIVCVNFRGAELVL